jgi:exonuclease III
MKIATYNVRQGGIKANKVHWERIFEAVPEPDIFLVQETRHPEEYVPSAFYQTHHQQILWAPEQGKRWGSALFVKSGTIKPLAVPDFPEGWIVGAEIQNFRWGEEQRPLKVFSLHAPAPYTRSVAKFLDFVESQFTEDCDLVIGGDFNVTAGIHTGAERVWLVDEMRTRFGLISCWQMANPGQALAQTLRWGCNTQTVYHCDGIFVPACWYRWLDACEVFGLGEWLYMSDHNPVVAYFADRDR